MMSAAASTVTAAATETPVVFDFSSIPKHIRLEDAMEKAKSMLSLDGVPDKMLEMIVRSIRACAPELDEFWHRLSIIKDTCDTDEDATPYGKECLVQYVRTQVYHSVPRRTHLFAMKRAEVFFHLLEYLGSSIWDIGAEIAREPTSILNTFWSLRTEVPEVAIYADKEAKLFLGHQFIGRRASSPKSYFRMGD